MGRKVNDNSRKSEQRRQEELRRQKTFQKDALRYQNSMKINFRNENFKNTDFERERAHEKIIKRVKVEDASDNEDEFLHAKSLRPSPGQWMEPIENKFSN